MSEVEGTQTWKWKTLKYWQSNSNEDWEFVFFLFFSFFALFGMSIHFIQYFILLKNVKGTYYCIKFNGEKSHAKVFKFHSEMPDSEKKKKRIMQSKMNASAKEWEKLKKKSYITHIKMRKKSTNGSERTKNY